MGKVRWWASGLAGYALLGGFVSSLGWVLDVPRLTDWIGNGISIQPNTALAASLAGASLILALWGARRAAAVLGGVVGLVGASVLFEHLTGINLGVDTLLMFGRSWGTAGALAPGRMGPPGAISWTLIGAALVSGTRGAKARAAVPVIAMLTLLIALLSTIGYLYGAQLFYTLPRVTIIALQTSSFVLALSVGLLLSVPERSPMRRLLEDSAAGALLRRAIPMVFLVPIVLGFLRLLGQRAGLYDGDFGTALRTLVEIVFFAGLLWWMARVIRRQTRLASARERLVEAIDHRLAGVLGSLSDPFVMFDRDFRFSFVNDMAESVMRKSRAELIGHNVWQVFPESVGNVSFAELHRAMAERVTVEYESYYEPWKQWFFSKAYPTGDGGLALFFRDVTERKLNEEALRAGRRQLQVDLAAMTRLQALSTQLVPADDLNSLLYQILVAAAEITGTAKASIQIYDPATERLRLVAHQGYGQRFLDRFRESGCGPICDKAAATHERVIIEDVMFDERLIDPEDRDVLLDDGIRAVLSTPLVSRDGRLLGILNSQFRFPHRPADHELRYIDLLARMAADVIERSIVEQALRQSEGAERTARGDAERASSIKDEFLATLSHELRSPLNAIMGWVRILEKRPADAKLAEEGIHVIARNAKAQSDLIADLIDMNRIISGKVRLEIGSVELADVIRCAVETTRPAAEGKHIRFELVMSPEADSIRGDAGRLEQIMCNLLSNAVKFTPKGGRVQVALTKTGSQADVTVSDTGVGIHAKFLPYVFDRFRQGDASTTREQGGLGLGLAIVKQLVELHGGTVHAESPGEGRGATFTVSLPLALMHIPDRDEPERRPVQAPAPVPPVDEVDLQGITILAVEDQVDARELLKVVLERCHANVFTAGSADEALHLLEQTSPDIILCDIGMPGKDGYEFITEVRKRQNQTPALAVTAFARTEDKVRALRAGFHAHVAKPIEPAELLSTLAVFARAGKN